MTETPSAPPGAPPPPPPSGDGPHPHDGPDRGPGEGWNTENLKDYRALRRSRTDRKAAGVAGGLGRHRGLDPTILRVLFVVLTFFGGAGLLLYIALWLVVPEEDTGRAVIGTSDSMRNALLIGAIVIAGLVAIGHSWGADGFPWLLLAGIILLAMLLNRDRRNGARPVPAPGAPVAGTPAWSEEDGEQPTQPMWAPPPVPVTPDPRRTGPLLFGVTLALLAVTLGALGLYDASGGSVTDSAYPALALAVIGVVLVVGAFVGRAGGLIALGLLTCVALAATAIARPTYHGDRDLEAHPATAADVRDTYEVPAGRIELDLSGVSDPASLAGRDIHLEANVGEIRVVVPRDVPVHFDSDVQYGGAIDTPLSSRDGWDTTLAGDLPATGGDSSADPLTVTADLDFGHIEVVRQP